MSMEPAGAAAPPKDGRLRAAHLLEAAVRTRQVWSLRNADGWVMMDDRGTAGLPIWPAADAAASSARGDWADCAPAAIPLAEWRERWLPSLARDGVRVVLWPVPGQAAVIVPAAEHAAHLHGAEAVHP